MLFKEGEGGVERGYLVDVSSRKIVKLMYIKRGHMLDEGTSHPPNHPPHPPQVSIYASLGAFNPGHTTSTACASFTSLSSLPSSSSH